MMQNAETIALRKRNPVKRALGILLLAAGGVGGGLFLFQSGHLEALLSNVAFLKIQEVRITSEWPLTSGMIKIWLPPLEGKNILFVRPMRLIELLEEKPWVDSVTVKKELPSRLLIDVATKRAIAIYLEKGIPHFLDAHGRIIEKATPQLFRTLELPVVSFDFDASPSKWALTRTMEILSVIQKGLEPKHHVSQLSLGSYPYFKIYLSPYRIEALFTLENWESQLPYLQEVLLHPPAALQQIRKINLVFPKKAVVSSNLSN